MSHEIVYCRCGQILKNCRCAGPKATVVSDKPCPHGRPTVLAQVDPILVTPTDPVVVETLSDQKEVDAAREFLAFQITRAQQQVAATASEAERCREALRHAEHRHNRALEDLRSAQMLVVKET